MTDQTNVASWEEVSLHTANDRFKARYPIYIRWATLASFIVYLALFLFVPQFDIKPYSLPEENVEVIDIPQDFDIPPPPKELPRPQVPIEAAPDAEVDEEVEIADTLPTDFDYVPPAPGGGGGNQDFVAFDTKPEILKYVSPVYTEFAREAAIEGLVLIDVLVGTDGKVQEAVIRQAGHNVLNQAALAAAKRCLFSPGKQRDRPVVVWVTLPFNFTLH